MAESVEGKTSWLAEKIGKERMRTVAGLALAAAGILGISGKPNTGVGVGVEVYNPFTGKESVVNVELVSSDEKRTDLGFSDELWKDIENVDLNDMELYQVSGGGLNLWVFTSSAETKYNATKKIIAIYPAAGTTLGSKK